GRRRGEAVSGFGNGGQELPQITGHAVEGGREDRDLVVSFHRCLERQIAGADLASSGGQAANPPDDAPGQPEYTSQNDDDDCHEPVLNVYEPVDLLLRNA